MAFFNKLLNEDPAVKFLAALLFVMTLPLCGYAVSHPLTLRQLVDIKWPSSPVWSPDGRLIAFVWDDGGVYNLWVTRADGQGKPHNLTDYHPSPDAGAPDERMLSGGFWSSDRKYFYYPYEGRLWKVNVVGGMPSLAWSSVSSEEDFTLAPRGRRVAFVEASVRQGGSDLIVRSLVDGTEVHVAHDAHSISGIEWSPDGKHLAYSGDSQAIPHNVMPTYTGHKMIFVITQHTRPTLYVVSDAGGEPVKVGLSGARDAHWINDSRLVFETESDDYKKRMIYVTDIDGGVPKMVHEDVESKFWSMPFYNTVIPSPDGHWIEFQTDTDGWDHIYVMPSDGGTPVKITRGNLTAWRPVWSHDSRRIAFDANLPGKPGDRQLGVATIGNDPAHATIQYITEGRGTNIAPLWSPNNKQVVFQHTDLENSADLFSIDVSGSAKAVRLTESMPVGIDHSAFVAPELVHYPGAHGQMVPAWLFLPKHLDKSKKHAAIVWVHGDGVNQNYDGWHVQRHYSIYYALNQYLVQEGYIVLAPDYRGSIGYGRAWRTGVYDSVGVDDETDVVKSADYLKTLPYVDSDRMGIYGLSYGGFFTLQTVTEYPTTFRAAVDIAGVADYAMYYEDPYHGAWTASRLGGSPGQNPRGYAAASPLDHAGQLQRPLLMMGGTADTNVPFLETLRMLDQFLKHGKGHLITFMTYPGEFHYFDREYVLFDAWSRVVHFFNAHLHSANSQPVKGTSK